MADGNFQVGMTGKSRFHPHKVIGIIIMLLCPLFLIARRFLYHDSIELLIMGIFGSLVMGSALWQIGEPPN